jgi:pimeloyl-ACP methyl ester carboxylesterase
MTGSGCWNDVADILTSAGHRVLTPSLTGLGDRQHLLSPEVDMNTHIRDVVNTLVGNDLRDVILVGHSYGGLPVTCAADQVPERIGTLVYLDALIAENGKTTMELQSPPIRDALIQSTSKDRGVDVIAPFRAEDWGVADPEPAAKMNAMMCPHPAKTFETRMVVEGTPGNSLPSVYIRCTDPVVPNLVYFHDLARSLGMAMVDLQAGHLLMATHPRLLAETLMKLPN